MAWANWTFKYLFWDKLNLGLLFITTQQGGDLDHKTKKNNCNE